jgi:hypothetical protein
VCSCTLHGQILVDMDPRAIFVNDLVMHDRAEELSRGLCFVKQMLEVEFAREMDEAAQMQIRMQRTGSLHRVSNAASSAELARLHIDAMKFIESELSAMHRGLSAIDMVDRSDDHSEIDEAAAMHQKLKLCVSTGRAIHGSLDTVQRPSSTGTFFSPSFKDLSELISSGVRIGTVGWASSYFLSYSTSYFLGLLMDQPGVAQSASKFAKDALVVVGQQARDISGMVAKIVRDKYTEFYEIRRLHQERLDATRRSTISRWLRDMGAPDTADVSRMRSQEDALVDQFRSSLQTSKNRLSVGGSKWTIAGEVDTAVREVKRIKLLRTKGKASLSWYTAQRTALAYTQWLGDMSAFVDFTMDALQHEDNNNSDFAQQVATMSGVSASVLLSGADSGQATIRKLRKLRDDIRRDTVEALAHTDELVRTKPEKLVAPAAPGAFAADDQQRDTWRQRIWIDCFAWGSAATQLRFAAPREEDAYEPYGGTEQLQYNSMLRPRVLEDFGYPVSFDADLAALCGSKSLRAQDKFELTDTFKVLQDRATELANVISAEPGFRKLLIRALRHEARERHGDATATTLASDYPFMPMLNTDARDYDVFAWPRLPQTGISSQGAAAEEDPSLLDIFRRVFPRGNVGTSDVAVEESPVPGYLPLPYVLYALVVQPLFEARSIEIEWIVTAVGTEDDIQSGTVYETLFTGWKSALIGLQHSTTHRVALYKVIDTDLAYARKFDQKDIDDSRLLGVLLGIRLCNTPVSSTPRLVRGLSAVDVQEPEGVLPEFYEMRELPNFSVRQDIALLRRRADYGVRLWVAAPSGNSPVPVPGVFWPVLCDNLVRFRQVRTVGNVEYCVEITEDWQLRCKPVGGIEWVVPMDANGGMESHVDSIHMARVSAEREFRWLSHWYKAAPWEIASKMTNATKNALGSADYAGTAPLITPPESAKWTTTGLLTAIFGVEVANDSTVFIGDVVSIRAKYEWAQCSYKSAGDYGVCPLMLEETDDWFCTNCWEYAPDSFGKFVTENLLVRHLKQMLQAAAVESYLDSQAVHNHQLRFMDLTLEGNSALVDAIERQRCRTLMFMMAYKVSCDIQSTFSEHLTDESYGPVMLMDATRNDFYPNFYSMVAFEVMYHRRMNGIRTTYAGDAKRQQKEYRLHKYVFRNARIIKFDKPQPADGSRQTEAFDAYLINISLPTPRARPVKKRPKVVFIGHPVDRAHKLLDMIG